MFSQVFFLNQPESILKKFPTHIKLVKDFCWLSADVQKIKVSVYNSRIIVAGLLLIL